MYSHSTAGNDVIVKLANDSLTLKNANGKKLNIISYTAPGSNNQTANTIVSGTSSADSIKNFAKERPGVVYDELREYFELGNAAPVTLSVNGPGSILVHGLRLDASPLTVNFFEGFPVEVYATPSAGGVWAGWSDGVMEMTRVVIPGETAALVANFN